MMSIMDRIMELLAEAQVLLADHQAEYGYDKTNNLTNADSCIINALSYLEDYKALDISDDDQ
jgi:hypothetical protein